MVKWDITGRMFVMNKTPRHITAFSLALLLVFIVRPITINSSQSVSHGKIKVTAVGDSVILGASPALEKFFDLDTHAIVALSTEKTIEMALTLHREGKLADIVIIHTGNNGTISDKQLKGLLDVLIDRKLVVLLNNCEPRDWVAGNNETFARIAPTYPNTLLVNWVAGAQGHPEYFYKDGIHLTKEGAQGYANLVAGHLFAHLSGGSQEEQRIKEYSSAIARNANDYESYFKRGREYSLEHDYTRAIRDCSKALELNPDYAEASFWRGLSYYKAGNNDNAIQDFSRAININPEYFEAYFWRGLCFSNKNLHEQAINDYLKSIVLNPSYSEIYYAYYYLGKEYILTGDYSQAIEEFSKAIEIYPSYAQAYYSRGYAYKMRGAIKESEADYAKAKKLNPSLFE